MQSDVVRNELGNRKKIKKNKKFLSKDKILMCK